jgi:hypothetical protein
MVLRAFYLFIYLFIIFFNFIHMCIQGLGHFSPLPPPQEHLDSGQEEAFRRCWLPPLWTISGPQGTPLGTCRYGRDSREPGLEAECELL